MSFNIEFMQKTDADFARASDELEQALLQSLRDDLEQVENQSFALVVKSSAGELLGGITASSSYNWLLIKLLWVRESSRGQGLGKQLLEDAETHGIAIGCHGAWLDTSNPQARQFYVKQGYGEFGRLENASTQLPPSHRRWFLKKAF